MGKMSTIQENLLLFMEKIKNEINCCLPAVITQVNSDGTVNVRAIRNDEIDDCVITVPVLRPETSRAYIQLSLQAGDRGIVKFCDKSIENYRLTGAESYNNDDRAHSMSDGIFQVGFLPNSEKFVFPSGEIVIGLKNGAGNIIIDSSGNLTINASQVIINSDVQVNGTLTATENVIGGGISLKEHTHGGVTAGSSTTGIPQ